MNISKHYLLVVVFLALSLCQCAPSWSERLADLDQERWKNKECIGFMLDSPWVQRGRENVGGWRTDSEVKLEITASWLSPYYRKTRKLVLSRLGDKIDDRLSFDASVVGDTISFRGSLLLKGQAPFPLTHRLPLASTLFKQPLGLWPTGVEGAKSAHRKLYTLPHPDIDLAAVLNGLEDTSKYIIIELQIIPILFYHDAKPGDRDIDDCLRMLLGQLILRGGALIDSGKGMHFPVKSAILAHDVGDEWERAAWRMSTEGIVIAPPTFARLYFNRSDFETLDTNNLKQIVFSLEAPRGSAGACSEDEQDGLDFTIELPFSAETMRLVGEDGF